MQTGVGTMRGGWRRAVWGLLIVLCFAPTGTTAAGFDPAPWREDYASLKQELERRWSHLAWFASEEGGVDLPALDRRTRRMIDAAESDADAAQAIRAFVTAIGDGHLSELPMLAPPNDPAPAPPPRRLEGASARDACAALGFGHRSAVAFSAPFEALPDFMLLSDGVGAPFRSGEVRLADGRRLAVVRIPRFRAQEYPETCEAIWTNDHVVPPDRDHMVEQVRRALLQALAERLRGWRDAGFAAVLVDIGGNGGGDDMGDWTARLFSDRPVPSAPLLMADADSSAGYFDEQLTALEAVRPSAAPARAANAIDEAIAKFTRGKATLGRTPCALDWAWRERRSWRDFRAAGGPACDRLAPGGYASGALPNLSAGSLGSTEIERALYWPTEVSGQLGAWRGAVYVLTDRSTASAAEMFAAVMRDGGDARIVGVRTLGLGCGFMTSSPPTVLPHSRLRFRIPNCVRLRGDGTDEVAGVTPDLPILPTEGEDERARAYRILRVLGNDLAGR